MNAIAVLTVTPSDGLLEFYSGFVTLGYRVFVFIDDNKFKFNNSAVWAENAGVSLIQIEDDECRRAGFVDLTIRVNPNVHERGGQSLASMRQAGRGRCTAWEKALYYFCRRDLSPDYVWFIEDDCFVPNHEVISSIDRKYGEVDIISAENEVNRHGVIDDPGNWPFWRLVPKAILRPPWAHSMVCTVRLSRRMLTEFDSLIRSTKTKLRFTNAAIAVGKLAGLFRQRALWRKKFFVEYIFHTLALRNRLRAIKARELSGVVFHKKWHVSEMNPSTIYHPLKDRDLHGRYRKIVNR
jgi:hypothetical protein